MSRAGDAGGRPNWIGPWELRSGMWIRPLVTITNKVLWQLGAVVYEEEPDA